MKNFSFFIAFATILSFLACGEKKEESKATAQNQKVETKTDQTTGATKQMESPAKKFDAVGQNAPDFSLPDVDGKNFALSELKGKYVVIDFWGTWCPWCVKGLPEMKKAYEKYGEKMEMVGIDCGDEEADWKKALKEHEMNWVNVFDPQGIVAEKYHVQGFPTKFVINPDGVIIKKVEGEEPAFYEYLDELFQ